jgi:hypothetical protein
MSGRNHVILAASVILASLGTDDATAQEPIIGVDGCAILAMLVYTEVTEAGLHGARAPGTPVYPGPDEITICNQTTRSVTSAFTASLRQLNIYVSWGYHPGYNGDYCQSHYLSQCYPDRNPYMPPLGVEDIAFVATSWNAVRGAVKHTMATTPGTDVSRFGRESLGHSIRFGLAVRPTGGDLAGALHSR